MGLFLRRRGYLKEPGRVIENTMSDRAGMNSGIRRLWMTWHSTVTSDRLVGLLLGAHVGHEVAHAVAVSELVVVPGGEARKKVNMNHWEWRFGCESNPC